MTLVKNKLMNAQNKFLNGFISILLGAFVGLVVGVVVFVLSAALLLYFIATDTAPSGVPSFLIAYQIAIYFFPVAILIALAATGFASRFIYKKRATSKKAKRTISIVVLGVVAACVCQAGLWWPSEKNGHNLPGVGSF